VAVNLRDYRIADNSGAFAEDSPVVADAADARFATLPVRAIVDAVRAEGIPAGLSLSAGTYLCNEVMFHSLERAARGLAPAISGFIHVPQLEAQHVLRPTDARPITERELLAAAGAVLRTVAEHCRDRA
jgi:pyroglutamyl-peptidase